MFCFHVCMLKNTHSLSLKHTHTPSSPQTDRGVLDLPHRWSVSLNSAGRVRLNDGSDPAAICLSVETSIVFFASLHCLCICSSFLLVLLVSFSTGRLAGLAHVPVDKETNNVTYTQCKYVFFLFRDSRFSDVLDILKNPPSSVVCMYISSMYIQR